MSSEQPSAKGGSGLGGSGSGGESQASGPGVANEMEPNAVGEMPQGDHPLEIAARRGIGPLSTHAEEVWHGHARPCVSCGLLVLRDQRECDHCGQDLSDEMLQRMKAHAGPWYVLEHLRPFPGVSLERLVRQIRRGVLTETSIIRGPATDFQWRFAVETPGICRHFGKCWNCQGEVKPTDVFCTSCLSRLEHDSSAPKAAVAGAEQGVPGMQDPAAQGVAVAAVAASTGAARSGMPGSVAAMPQSGVEAESSESLEALRHAVRESRDARSEPDWDEPPKILGIRATWVALIMVLVVVIVLVWFVNSRGSANAGSASLGLPQHVASDESRVPVDAAQV